jgi:hypothetical protein
MRAVRKLGRVQASGDAVVSPGQDVLGPLDDSIEGEVDVIDVPGRYRDLPGDAPRDRLAIAGRDGFHGESGSGTGRKRDDEQNGDKEEMERKALGMADGWAGG